MPKTFFNNFWNPAAGGLLALLVGTSQRDVDALEEEKDRCFNTGSRAMPGVWRAKFAEELKGLLNSG